MLGMEGPGQISPDGYFGRPMADVDLARLDDDDGILSPSGLDALSSAMRDGAYVGGDTLDEIVLQNRREMERRRSMQPPYGRTGARAVHSDLRRTSMMDYEPAVTRPGPDHPYPASVLTVDGNLILPTTPSATTTTTTTTTTAFPTAGFADPLADPARRHPAGALALDTRFAGPLTAATYPNPQQPPPPPFAHPASYPSAIHSASSLQLGGGADDSYHTTTDLSAHSVHAMPTATFAPVDHDGRAHHLSSSLMKHPHFSPAAAAAAMRPFTRPQGRYPPPPSFIVADRIPGSQDPGGGGPGPVSRVDPLEIGDDDVIVMDVMPSSTARDPDPVERPAHHHHHHPYHSHHQPRRHRSLTPDLDENDLFPSDPILPDRPSRPVTFETRVDADADSGRGQPPNALDLTTVGIGQQGPDFGDRTNAEQRSLFRNIYSSSGFDMLKVLMRVATRPDPEISIGAVDMSCAFVVCDVSQHDIPIVYCSDVFERLTGYTRHEILGRNCRFLQAPDGKVKSGLKRHYVDDQVVFRLKKKITDRREVQTSLINYRKGGQPFMNLLTMIPITWDTSEVRFYVGFQVDLVETPQSVTNKNPDGTYSINYQRGYLPRYVLNTPDHRHAAESGQTIPRDDVSTVLGTIGTGESELSKRIWDKVLLENTDDVVHVLSLKGLFLYLSPSSRKVLGYDSSELVGTALSSVCHPSDIVPVTRELKDTSAGATVNVVFRIRRKHTGYTWFESHGSLHTEQGKGRKCIILVGRERPVYALARTDVDAAGGIGDGELWSKMSTSGMFLFVASHSKSLLDRPPEELVGTSIQALMRKESKLEFGRQLEVARTGKRTRVKHEMQNRRGQALQAHTTLHPGDAVEGQKPTFLVAQTRLVKMSRSMPAAVSDPSKPASSSNRASTPSSAQSGQSPPSAGGPRANTCPPPMTETVTTQPGCGGLPIGTQDDALAAEDNVFDELKTTRSTSWQFELRQMEKRNRLLVEEMQSLLSAKKKRKRRRGAEQMQKDCANCHTRVTPEWRRGPSGNRDLCNSCGLRWAKQNGRASPRTSSQHSDKQSVSPVHSSPPIVDNLSHPVPGAMLPPESRPNNHNEVGGRFRKDFITTSTGHPLPPPSTASPC